MKKIIFLILLLFSFESFPQGKTTVVKYKQYEKFDLGKLDVDGEIITPGDLTVDEIEDVYDIELIKKPTFRNELNRDMKFYY